MRDLLSLVEKQDVDRITKVHFPIYTKIDMFDIEIAGLLKFANPKIKICFYEDEIFGVNCGDNEIVISEDESSKTLSCIAHTALLLYLPYEYLPDCSFSKDFEERRYLEPVKNNDEYKERFIKKVNKKVEHLCQWVEKRINDLAYCQSFPSFIQAYLWHYWKDINWENLAKNHIIPDLIIEILCNTIEREKTEEDEFRIKEFLQAILHYGVINEKTQKELTNLVYSTFEDDETINYYLSAFHNKMDTKMVIRCKENCFGCTYDLRRYELRR